MSDRVVILTESAIKEMKRIRVEQNITDDTPLHVACVGGGCSGFSYKLNFDEEPIEKDRFNFDEQGGVKIAVDKRSALYLKGTTIDWVELIDKRGFKFDNPQSLGVCGCGSSFHI